MNRTPRAAIYLRVSTNDQTCEHQRGELLPYAERAGLEPIEFKDTISGKTTNRRGLDALIRRARAGEFKAVMVAKLDRLGRSLVHLVNLIAEFDKLGVAVIAPGQGVDTSHNNPAGRLQMNMLFAVAEFERSLIVSRTRAGLATARANGKRLGRPTLMPERKTLAEAILARNPGLSIRGLAVELGCSVGTAARVKAALAV
jgi:DNA invertase Pin-like site-specific DNA recombinase